MRTTELSQSRIDTAAWGHQTPHRHVYCETPQDFLTVYQPHVCVNLRDRHRSLKEATYKEIASLIDPEFLMQGVRAAELKGIRLDVQNRGWAKDRPTAFDPEDTLNFLIDSAEKDTNNTDYLNSIKFEEWDEVGSDPDLNSPREKALMLLWVGNIRLHCTCPSFLFWGYQYLLTVIDASIYPEIRRPVIRNGGSTRYGPPADRGIVCKHMNRILKALPFYNGAIAKEIKEQFGS